MARRDVDLVIRARDEAKGALDAITRTLEKFTGAQKETQAEAQKTDTQLDRLGASLQELQKNLKGLTAGGTVAQELERARTAVERLSRATKDAAGEAIGYQREALKSARATAELRAEAERVDAAIRKQETAVAKARAAQRQLASATQQGTAAQQRYAEAQERLGRNIAEQNLRLANYRARFRELQIEITKTAQPTAQITREFDRTAANIERTQAKLRDLTETQRLVAAEQDRASRSIQRANDLYGSQAASVQKSETVLKKLQLEQAKYATSLSAATTQQNRLDAAAQKAAQSLAGQDAALEKAQASYRQIEGVVRETEGALTKLEATARGPLLRAFGEQAARLKETEQSFRQNSIEAQRLSKELRETAQPSRELREAFESYRAAAARGRQEVREQQRVLAELRSVLRQTGGDVDTFAQRQERFASALNRGARSFREYGTASQAAVNANQRLVRSQQQAQQSTDRLTGSTQRLGAAKQNAARSTGLFADAIRRSYGESRQALSFTQRLRSEVLALVAAYSGFFAAIQGIRGVVTAFQTLEATQSRLLAIFDGNTAQIDSEIDFLRRNADRLGIELGTLADLYSKFAVATRGTNLEGQATRDIFISVAEAGRVNKLSLDNLRGTFLALEQMVSKGSVTMEELRRQLGDRLPGAFQIMADAVGVTTAELSKMIEQGQLSSDVLIDFAAELDKRFGGALPTALETTTTAIGRLQNAIFQTFLRIGEAGAIERFTVLINDLTATLQSAQFESFAERVGSALGKLFDIIGGVVRNFDLIIVAITTFIGLKIAPFVVALVTVLARLPAILRLVRIKFSVMRGELVATSASLAAATGAVARLRAALTVLLSSTGIGLLVTLIGTAIGLWITRTDKATEAMGRHRDLLDQVRNAYDQTGASVEEWRAAVEGLTLTQARANLQALQQQLGQAQNDFRNLIPRNIFGGVLDAGGGYFRQVEQLFDQFRSGSVNVDEFLSSLDDLAESYRDLFPVNARFAEQFDEQARKIREVAQETADANDIIIALTGDADEAAAALRRLARESEDLGDDLDRAAQRAQQFQEALDELKKLVPELAQEMERLAERAKLEDAYRSALQLAQGYREVSEAFNIYRQGLDALNAREIDSFVGGSLVDRIIGVESAGNPNARNPNSTATGLGQFIESTWLDLFRRYFPERAESLSRSAILALREDPQIARRMVDIYVRELAQQLQAGGLPVTDANVYLSYFLGPGGAASVLRAAPGTVANDILPSNVITANASVLDGKTREQIIAWAQRKVGLSREQLDVEEQIISNQQSQEEQLRRQAEREEEQLQRQRDATSGRIADGQFQIAQQELINLGREREAAITEAVRRARQENANISEQELATIAEQAGRLYDLQNAERLANAEKERALAAEQRVNELLSLRSQLQQELTELLERGGDANAIENVRVALEGVNEQLREAIDNALQMLTALQSQEPAIQTAISRMRQLQATSQVTAQGIVLSWSQIEKVLADNLANAAMRFAESLAEGKSVTESLRDAFLQFAADFLRQIAQMILQQLALNAAKAIGRAFGFGVMHTGGVVGSRTAQRRVGPSVFAGAMRYHTGGVAGLRPGEVPTILERGEEVLTRDDPRHIFNGGGKEGGSVSVTPRIVNAIDGASFMEEAMKEKRGQEVILNYIQANRSAVRGALGV